MSCNITKSWLLLLFLTPISFIQAQIEKGELFKGKRAISEISPNEKHHFTINLEKDQFAFFRLMQKGVDMKITTYDSEGEKMEDFDTPNGKNGPELFTLISSKQGVYVVEVSTFDEKEPSGKYEITAELIKPKATLPNERVDEIFAPWDSNETPGAAVAIVKDGTIIYKKGYGLANLEYDIPISPTSVFHIASISKKVYGFFNSVIRKTRKIKSR